MGGSALFFLACLLSAIGVSSVAPAGASWDTGASRGALETANIASRWNSAVLASAGESAGGRGSPWGWKTKASVLGARNRAPIILRGGASAQVQSARAPGFVTKTQEADSSEMLAAHKAALRARAAAHGASRPVLLSKMEGSLSGASMQDPAAMGKTLSLVRPNIADDDERDEEKEVEGGKKFEAFQGTGHVMLTPGEVKKSSAGQMHRLAIARLARMSKAMLAETKGEEVAVQTEEEMLEEDKAYIEQHLRQLSPTKKAAVEAHCPDFLMDPDVVINKRTKLRSISKGGTHEDGNWWKEKWTEVSPGQFTLEGENSQGHKWGEVLGVHPNGTSFKDKYLIKEAEGYVERNGWTSDGVTSGLRSGRAEDGKVWEESWRQSIVDGITKGLLEGINEYNETWQEEWEVIPLAALNPETGEQMVSTCGEKSGVDREGMKWSQSWGQDDLMGRWGTKSQQYIDGSDYTEHWGENMEGDVWCSKWGVRKCDLGVSEEWGVKCGQKNLRVGQEMDGYTNMEEGKIETWTEQWCKTFEADGRLAGTQAEKVGDNGFGDKWVEKWNEKYAADGSTEKWASKYGKKEVTNDEWKEDWGERRDPPTEADPDGKRLSCWAEMHGTNGFGDTWHDAWGEELCPLSGRGSKQCNKWKKHGDGKEAIERSGEEWDGKGWYQKGGETIVDGERVGGWHDRAW